MLLVIVIYTALGVLTYLGVTAPWSPKMTAWSGDPVPEELVERCTPLQLQGAVMLQNKNCRNCHALEGIGGRRGPDLTTVGTRLTRDQLIDQISNGTPGGGNMPAYGKQMNPAEMTALVEFLVSLRPAGQPPARSAAVSRRDQRGRDEPTFDAFLRSWPFDPWLVARSAAAGRDLPARLAGPPSPRPAPLARRPARRASWAGWRRSSWPWLRRSSRSPPCCCKST